MTCVDRSEIRRGRPLAGFSAAFAAVLAVLRLPFAARAGDVDDLDDHMLRDIGFRDGRVTAASMRRVAERWVEIDRF
ncbi:hypothetical protein [Pleomorphomonas koreensis]|uniref:hypothetical protein n=1 Tax=Pleomorphomonas koreensis TaxID=257440 RepID=UPI0012ECB878|nr:hypothetical protein [Pleomorphomonas koreensis]